MLKQKSVKIFLLLFFIICLGFQSVTAQSNTNLILSINVDGPLTPALVGYIQRSLVAAEDRGAEMLVLQLNTPGGSIDLMNRIVQDIRASSIPVIVYVAPRGAIAGSAGTLITLAGHVAVMAPETAIGAASPVGGQGEDLGETIESKQKEILRASVRSLAASRGTKAISLAEDTIENAKAVSSEEALEAGLIDLVANDINDLLTKLDGRTVTTINGDIVLNTANYNLLPVEMSFIEQLLQLLTNPNVLFLLLTIGVQAIFIELSNPGGWVAGFIGAVSLILAVYGMGILPVNWFGILFILVAFVLFILEVKAPTHGALTTAGAASFIIGALVLFNSVGAFGFERLSIPLVIAVGLILAGAMFVVVSFGIRAMRRPVLTGMNALTGKTGYVVSPLNPQGSVQVAGELWGAIEENELYLSEDTPIEVTGKQGIKLIVRKRV
jgi:membrane-bound serine protease (ClpP class)